MRALAAGGGLVALVLVGLVVWWWAARRDFLYRAIFPDDARLLAGQEIPPVLGTEPFLEDLEFLSRELPRLHVAFDRAFDRERFAERAERLAARAGSWPSARRQLELTGLVAGGGRGTGHTMILPLQRALDWRLYPLSTYLFGDGLFITDAGEADRWALGKRVLTVGGEPAAAVLERLAPYVPSDNEWSRAANLPLLLSMAEPLIALGLAAEDGTLVLGLGGGDELEVRPMALASWAGLIWGRRTQSPVAGAWSPADLRPRVRPYRLERGPDPETLWLSLDSMRDDPDEPFAALAERLDRMAREAPVDRLVIDLRANGGGNNELPEPLLATLAGHPVLDRSGVLFVLIGRHTFSAAGNFTAGLERRTRALFVGEPSGFAPGHYGDARPILLPGSKLVARVASRHWREDLPGVERDAIEPDLRMPFLSRHHFEDRDPAPAAIRDHQKRLAIGKAPKEAVPVPAESLGAYLVTPLHRARIVGGDGKARLLLDEVGPFAATDLHGGAGGRWTTGIRGVELELAAGSTPRLDWMGTVFSLTPVAPDHRLPFELVAAGEVEAGVAAYRAAAAEVAPASAHELVLNRIGYRLLEEGRTGEAVNLFALLTELFPQSANTFDSLGDGLSAAGDPEGAVTAYRRSLALDPLFDHSRRRIAELEAAGRN